MADFTPKAGEVELAENRTAFAKTFVRPGGKRVAVGMRRRHYQEGGTWKEVDTSISTADNRTFTVASAPYSLSFDKRQLSVTYTSKAGGSVTIRLLQVGGVNLGPFNGSVTKNGRDAILRVATDLDIVLRVRPYGIEIYKVLQSANAPKSMRWEVSYANLGSVNLDLMGTKAFDNQNRQKPRAGFDLVRRAEVDHVKSAETVTGGVTRYTVDEILTGRTRLIDPETMARSWVNEIVYPVEIDVTVTENIGTTADDGRSAATPYWNSNGIRNGIGSTGTAGAWRFQTVDVPQGATINSAILTVNVTSRSGSGNTTLSGEAVDDAASWSYGSANGPLTMAATTANTTYAFPASTGIKTIDVTSIVQEIVNRAGWTNNNDMRLGFTSIAGLAGGSYVYFEDYQAAGTDEAQLDIDYSTGGATGQPTMRRFGGVPGMGQGQTFGRSW